MLACPHPAIALAINLPIGLSVHVIPNLNPIFIPYINVPLRIPTEVLFAFLNQLLDFWRRYSRLVYWDSLLGLPPLSVPPTFIFYSLSLFWLWLSLTSGSIGCRTPRFRATCGFRHCLVCFPPRSPPPPRCPLTSAPHWTQRPTPFITCTSTPTSSHTQLDSEGNRNKVRRGDGGG